MSDRPPFLWPPGSRASGQSSSPLPLPPPPLPLPLHQHTLSGRGQWRISTWGRPSGGRGQRWERGLEPGLQKKQRGPAQRAHWMGAAQKGRCSLQNRPALRQVPRYRHVGSRCGSHLADFPVGFLPGYQAEASPS